MITRVRLWMQLVNADGCALSREVREVEVNTTIGNTLAALRSEGWVITYYEIL